MGMFSKGRGVIDLLEPLRPPFDPDVEFDPALVEYLVQRDKAMLKMSETVSELRARVDLLEKLNAVKK